MDEIRQTETHTVKTQRGRSPTPWLVAIIILLLIGLVALFFTYGRGRVSIAPGANSVEFDVRGPGAPPAR
jgi:hypothetical protein